MRSVATLLVIVLTAGCGASEDRASVPPARAPAVAPTTDEEPLRRRHAEAQVDAAVETWRAMVGHRAEEPDPYQEPDEMLELVGADAVTRIAPALASPQLEDSQREDLLCILRQLGPHALPALDAVLAVLGEANSDLQLEAVSAIGAMGPGAARAIPALRDAMGELGGGSLFAAVFAALGPAGWDELDRMAFGAPEPAASNSGLNGFALLDPETSLPFAVRALMSDDAIVRLNALSLFRDYAEGARAHVDAVVRALDDEDEDVRGGALATLEDMGAGAVTATPIVLERLRALPEEHDDYGDWLGTLAHIGARDAAAVHYLAAMAASGGDWSSRAADLLKDVHADTRAVLPELRVALDGDSSVRMPVLNLLYRMGPDAAPALPAVMADLAPDRHDGVRQCAARALMGIGPAAEPALPALRDLGPEASPNLQVLAALAIYAISGDADPARAVMASLADQRGDHVYSWRYEIPGMMGAGGAVFLPELREMLVGDDDDSRGYVMVSVLGSFEAIGPPAASAVPDLIAALDQERNSVWADDIAEALDAIGIDDEQALAVWMPLLRHEFDSTRRSAAEALGRRGPAAAPALRDLRRLERDSDWRVRRAARDAIAAIGG